MRKTLSGTARPRSASKLKAGNTPNGTRIGALSPATPTQAVFGEKTHGRPYAKRRQAGHSGLAATPIRAVFVVWSPLFLREIRSARIATAFPISPKSPLETISEERARRAGQSGHSFETKPLMRTSLPSWPEKRCSPFRGKPTALFASTQKRPPLNRVFLRRLGPIRYI